MGCEHRIQSSSICCSCTEGDLVTGWVLITCNLGAGPGAKVPLLVVMVVVVGVCGLGGDGGDGGGGIVR